MVRRASSKMVHRSLSDELQKIAVEQLHEDPERIDENLQHFRVWLHKQPHLKINADDQTFLNFLRGCKWSLQRAKERLDYFYTIRTLIPEFFGNRDPYCEDIQRILHKGVCSILPKPEYTNGPKICFVDLSNIIPEEMSPISLLKLCFMMADILINEDDNVIIAGVKLLIDFSKIPISYILQFTPATLKKIILCAENVYPIRLKKCVALNVSVGIETIYNNLFKPFMSNKQKERVALISSSNLEKIDDHIAKAFLPEKYGGENGSCSELIELWKTKVESYSDWFLEENKNVCDEQLRPHMSKSYNEEFNMEGTFRKLTVD